MNWRIKPRGWNAWPANWRTVSFGVIDGREKPALFLRVPLTESGRAIYVTMEGKEVRYLPLVPDGAMITDFRDDRMDHGVFVMLAELTE